MAIINRQDTDGTKGTLLKGELGYDDYTAGGDEKRVYVGDGTTNHPLAGTDLPSTFTAGQAGSVTVLTSGTNVSIDLADSNNYSLAIATNATLDNPTNIVVGQSGIIAVTQDGTGSRTLDYGTYYKFSGGDTPTLTTTASAMDLLAYYVVSSTQIIISDSLDIS